MKEHETSRKAAFIGLGMGLTLFVVFGFLPGAFIGGVAGLSIAGAVTGYPVTSATLPRLVVGMSMVGGVFVSCVIFSTAASMTGWLLGAIIDGVRLRKGA
jgi:hypothetical protein